MKPRSLSVPPTLALLARQVKRERGAVLRVLAVGPRSCSWASARCQREESIVVGLTSCISEAIGLAPMPSRTSSCDLHLPDADGADAIVRLRSEAPARCRSSHSASTGAPAHPCRPPRRWERLRLQGHAGRPGSRPSTRRQGLVALGREARRRSRRRTSSCRRPAAPVNLRREREQARGVPRTDGVAPSGSGDGARRTSSRRVSSSCCATWPRLHEQEIVARWCSPRTP
jgi:hypothetical protein